ncbi:peroxide stress protein YaaA [uncultured Flavobacterium sp.]|uniref:peroxide stress protein YaaA n=1 Tax=uncultured Flavobacterium sp. TaxID=165435 RepID=UPI0030CA2A31
MKIVISPAKSLNFESLLPTTSFTEPQFLKEANTIQKTLKKKNPRQLMDLMSISEKLADLNWNRNQEWHMAFTTNNARPAIFTFDGEVYSGIDAHTISKNKLTLLQDRLRIISGLYGLLKPLDLMQAYRLEMGTSIQIGADKNLYEFWKKTITNALNVELIQGELFVNLASKEYFSAIDTKSLKVPVITPEFKDYKDGKLRMISFFAKKARGLMVRYIIDTQAETIDDLKGFDYQGYVFDANLSNENTLVFTR